MEFSVIWGEFRFLFVLLPSVAEPIGKGVMLGGVALGILAICAVGAWREYNTWQVQKREGMSMYER